MKNLKSLMPVLVLSAAVVALTAGSLTVYAHQLNKKGKVNNPDQVGFQIDRQAIKQAILNNNYDAWKKTMSANSNLTDKITEENFNKLVKFHQLIKEGKKDEAEALLKETGLGAKNFDHKKIVGRQFNNDAVRQAIANNDYSAWKEAVANMPGADKITQADFDNMVKLHRLIKEGKNDEVKQLKTQLGMGFNRRGQAE